MNMFFCLDQLKSIHPVIFVEEIVFNINDKFSNFLECTIFIMMQMPFLLVHHFFLNFVEFSSISLFVTSRSSCNQLCIVSSYGHDQLASQFHTSEFIGQSCSLKHFLSNDPYQLVMCDIWPHSLKVLQRTVVYLPVMLQQVTLCNSPFLLNFWSFSHSCQWMSSAYSFPCLSSSQLQTTDCFYFISFHTELFSFHSPKPQ
jgi:hypothetical protein